MTKAMAPATIDLASVAAKGPACRRVMEEILEKEEEHADDMSTLLARIEKESSESA